MKALSKILCNRMIGLIIGLCLSGAAVAHSGDVYEVTASRVNLRAGPSNDATVLTTVQQGDKLLELRREGSWVGVRVLNTSDEGWIYSELIKLVSQSRLSRQATTTSLSALSTDFAELMDKANKQLGYPIIDGAQIVENTTLRLMPTREWLLRTGSDAHLMAALAFYQMWKNHHGGSPVTLVLTDGQDNAYLTIKDEESGPTLSIEAPRQ